MKELLQFAVQNGGLKIEQFFNDNHGTVINHKEPTPSPTNATNTFPRAFDEERGIRIFDGLKNKEYIGASTAQDNFLFIIGCTTTPPFNRLPIEWLATKECARCFIEDLCFKDLTMSGAIRKKDLMELTRINFILNGSPLELPKPRQELSKRIDDLRKLFSDLKKSET